MTIVSAPGETLGGYRTVLRSGGRLNHLEDREPYRLLQLRITPDLDIGPVPHPVEERALTGEETDRRSQDFELLRDVQAEVAGTTERERLILSTGMRSWLRVPVQLSGEVRGGLSFFHREPAQYERGDAEVAGRLADRVALMLSHQQLAEEARVAAEARERAERLEATVEIETGVVKGVMGKRVLKLLFEWTEQHQDELKANWVRARERRPLKPIPPLT